MPKYNKRSKQYTKEFKESVLKRLEPPINETVRSLSEELEIPRSTLYQWVRIQNKNQNSKAKSHKPTRKWSSEDKFHVVLETSVLTEEELAACCRRKGLYVDEVKTWREQCLKANATTLEDSEKLKQELKANRILLSNNRCIIRHFLSFRSSFLASEILNL
jgi:transposase